MQGGSRGVSPPAGRWQERNPFSGRGFIVVVVYGGVWTVYATEKDWVGTGHFLSKERSICGCRSIGGSGGVSPPAGRWQEPNPLSGRVMDLAL
jgi:hypothetical protein